MLFNIAALETEEYSLEVLEIGSIKVFVEDETSASHQVRGQLKLRIEVLNLLFIRTPFNLASTYKDPHEVLRVLVLNYWQADVYQFWEELVECNMLNLQIWVLCRLEDAEEHSGDFLENCWLSHGFIICLLFINCYPL